MLTVGCSLLSCISMISTVFFQFTFLDSGFSTGMPFLGMQFLGMQFLGFRFRLSLLREFIATLFTTSMGMSWYQRLAALRSGFSFFLLLSFMLVVEDFCLLLGAETEDLAGFVLLFGVLLLLCD